MKVVGNCPSCGNPIWADGPEVTRRTCFCLAPLRTQPITITPQPYYPPLPYTWPPGTWWCGDPNVTITSTANMGAVSYIQPPKPPKPPDSDAGMVT